MAGKQAKILGGGDFRRILKFARTGRHPERDQVIVLLSVKAGLRACEIAGLTWSMVLDPTGRLGDFIEVGDHISKRRRGRTVPLNDVLRAALARLHRYEAPEPADPIVASERGGHMRPMTVVNWFASLYRRAQLEGCSSHSGRRTFITNAARQVHRVGGSLRDVQQLAGHSSLDMTQRYIEGRTEAKRALVNML